MSSVRLRSHALSALAIAVSCLAAYNTFGDNTAVKEEAKRVAGCPSCEIAAEDRNPFRQELSVAKKGGTVVVVRCSRALWLVGSYGCALR